MGWGGVGMLTFSRYKNGWRFQCQDRSIHSILAMEMGKRVVSWPVEKTAQVYVHNDHWNWQGKKRSGFRVEGLPNARKMTFFFKSFTLRRLRNTERVVIFWPWWCAYTRDSAPGGMFMQSIYGDLGYGIWLALLHCCWCKPQKWNVLVYRP